VLDLMLLELLLLKLLMLEPLLLELLVMENLLLEQLLLLLPKTKIKLFELEDDGSPSQRQSNSEPELLELKDESIEDEDEEHELMTLLQLLLEDESNCSTKSSKLL